MREQELREVVEAVVRVLAERGLISGGGGGPAAALPPVQVTTGTAGKVFSGEWSYKKPGGIGPDIEPCLRPGGPGQECRTRAAACHSDCAQPVTPAMMEGDHTYDPNCPHCNPVGKVGRQQLRDIGADRIGVCHPTKACNEISSLVDHTLLKPGATQEQVAKLCEEAKSYCFASVCVNPAYVRLAARILQGSGVKNIENYLRL